MTIAAPLPTSPTLLHHSFRYCRIIYLDFMATAATPSPSKPSRPTYSCIRCADRKVKCDQQRPCTACVKHNADCVFNLSRPPKRRPKRVKDQILEDRLKLYEALLQERGIDPSKLPATPKPEPPRRSSHTVAVLPQEPRLQTPSSVEAEPSPCFDKAQVVHGQGRPKFVEK